MRDERNEREWEQIFRQFLEEAGEDDPAHDLGHIERVVRNARLLSEQERADWAVVMPAAWLHDCVYVPKDSPQRSVASRLSSERAVTFLTEVDYPGEHYHEIGHAILAHSYSAGIVPETLAAQVLQDADRIDALGAVGLSRCLLLGGHLGTPLMSQEDPFCEEREPDDSRYTIDHFYRKLLKLENTMQTVAGKSLAQERTQVLRDFLAQLRAETGA